MWGRVLVNRFLIFSPSFLSPSNCLCRVFLAKPSQIRKVAYAGPWLTSVLTLSMPFLLQLSQRLFVVQSSRRKLASSVKGRSNSFGLSSYLFPFSSDSGPSFIFAHFSNRKASGLFSDLQGELKAVCLCSSLAKKTVCS